MVTLSKSDVETMIRINRQGLDSYGELDLCVPAFENTFKIYIELLDGADVVSDKTVQTINDIVNLTPESRSQIRRLLYDDAMQTRGEAEFGEPSPLPEEPPVGFRRRLIRRPNEFRFAPLEADDPRHPCHFENGVEGVEEKVEWLQFNIDENLGVVHRFALLDCRPQWEEEHGVTVVIRDGIPVGIDAPFVNVADYDAA